MLLLRIQIGENGETAHVATETWERARAKVVSAEAQHQVMTIAAVSRSLAAVRARR
jgi:hypothetical protein